MLVPIILVASIVTLLFIYLLGKSNERYWTKRGVKFYEKNKVSGILWDFITHGGALFERYVELYNEYKNEPALGMGSFGTPALFIINPKNVAHVLHADFNSFYHRGLDLPKNDQLTDNVLFMNGPRWKLMRQNMTPLFTAAKLKNMYYIIDKSAADFIEHLKNNPKTCKGDFYETLLNFCNAALCGAIFGISSESIFDSPFLKVATQITTPNLKNNIKLGIMSISITLMNLLGLTLFKEYEDFLIGAISSVIEKRKKENVKKHDFADLCVAIQKNGTMKDPTTGCEIEPTNGILTAQAMFFLQAGVEPVAITIFSTLVEIGTHPEVAERLQREIDGAFDSHGKSLSYDVIADMTYLDQVISETMRISPPIGYLTRQCVKDTVLPVGNVKVDKGTKIFTPIYPIHHDPDIYPNPEVFDPERFANERKLSDDYYMPFGLGARMCIGARYAKLQMAAGIVHILRNFDIKINKLSGPKAYSRHFFNVRRTDVDIELIPRSFN